MIFTPFNPLMKNYFFNTPKRVIFGLEATKNTGLELKALGAERILFVTDPMLEKCGIAENVRKHIEGERIEVHVFNQVEPEPDIEVAEAVTKKVRETKFDAVVGVGGGSSLDIAKIAAVMATNPGNPTKYLGVGLVKKPRLPLVLVPTTAGTGSEVTGTVVISVENRKRIIKSPEIVSNIAIVDPKLTLTLPPRGTAITGCDALSHAIESLLSIRSFPLTDALNLKAIELIAEHLKRAYHQGKNLEARWGMALAATTTGLAFSNTGLAFGHNMSNTIDARYHLPHGVAVALTLPYTMHYALSTSANKLALVASKMGETVSGLTEYEAALRSISAVWKLIKAIDMPTNLRQVGVSKEKIPQLASEFLDLALKNKSNPQGATEKSAQKLYEQMWEGNILS